MAAAKKVCLKVYVVQMGSLSGFELLICVLHVLKCRCESAGIASRPFIILKIDERRQYRLLSASGFQPSWDIMLVKLLIGL